MPIFQPTSAQIQSVLFTSSGTWTCPAGVNKVKVTVAGAGGGSGTGAFGGVGGYGMNYYSVVPGTVYTVTVGTGGTGGVNGTAGGNTSFSTFITATGGTGATGGIGGSSGGCANALTNTISNGGALFPFIGSSSNTNGLTAPRAWTSNSGLIPGACGDAAINAGGVSGVVLLEYNA